MSEHNIRYIPADPYFVGADCFEAAAEYLKNTVKAENIAMHIYDKPEFIDCGENLESISCPLCGGEISFDFFGEAMDEAYENDFSRLGIRVPCCGAEVSLNDLKYHFPCGIASMEITVSEPEKEPGENIFRELEKITGVPLREIIQHI